MRKGREERGTKEERKWGKKRTREGSEEGTGKEGSGEWEKRRKQRELTEKREGEGLTKRKESAQMN